ncbi:hypothetical protein B0H21DRAFT_746398 [Amylocystis lapponica]|nr:hypothetical protein B0H21DRAFT_746398 [Amylocystis lapponica]
MASTTSDSNTSTFEHATDEVTHYKDTDGSTQPIPPSATLGPPVTPLEFHFLQQHCLSERLPVDYSSSDSIEDVCSTLVEEVEATRRLVLGIQQHHTAYMKTLKAAREKLPDEFKSIQESYAALNAQVQYHKEDIREIRSRMKAVQRLIDKRLDTPQDTPTPSLEADRHTLMQSLDPPPQEKLTVFPKRTIGDKYRKMALYRSLAVNVEDPRPKRIQAAAAQTLILDTPTSARAWSLAPSARIDVVTSSASTSDPPEASSSASASDPPEASSSAAASSSAVDPSGQIPPHLKIHLDKVVRAVRSARMSVSKMLLNKSLMEEQQTGMYVEEHNNMVKAVWDTSHRDATNGVFGVGYEIKRRLEPAVGCLERIMEGLAPAGDPEADSDEQVPLYAITLDIESKKAIDDLTEEEAKALLRSLPLQVVFDPQDAPAGDVVAECEDDGYAATEARTMIVGRPRTPPRTKTGLTPVERWRRRRGLGSKMATTSTSLRSTTKKRKRGRRDADEDADAAARTDDYPEAGPNRQRVVPSKKRRVRR